MIYSYSQLFDPKPYEYGPWLSHIMPDQCLVFNGGDFGTQDQWETSRETVSKNLKQAVAQFGITSIKIDLSMSYLVSTCLLISKDKEQHYRWE